MWDQFLASIVVCCFFLILPGYFILRGLNCDRLKAVIFAPIFAVLLYAILGIVYSKFSLTSTWASVFLGGLVLGLCVFVVSCFIRKKRRLSTKRGERKTNSGLLFAFVYVGLSVALGCIFFLANLPSADSFFQAYDNIYHLSVIRSFLDSGDWSILKVSLFATANFDPPLPGGGFYPAGWHILCAMLVSSLNVPIAVAVNAVNFVFSFILFPLSMFALLSTIFKDEKAILIFGSIVLCAFGSFPWGFLTFGPLYPNLTSFALLPLLITAFIYAIEQNQSIGKRALWIVVFVIGVGAMAVMQPNAVFTVGVFLAPYCVYRIYLAASDRFNSSIKAVVCAAGFVAFVCAFWWFLYKSPFMLATLSQLYPNYYSKPMAVVHLLTLWFRDSSPNFILGALVIIGGIYTLKHRQYLWLSFSYAFAAVLYVVDASLVDVSFVKNLLTGFWYSDIYRIEAMLGLFGIPLAALGVFGIYSFISGQIKKKKESSQIDNCVRAGLMLLLLVCLFVPLSGNLGSTQFARVTTNISEDYSLSSGSILSDDEAMFLKDVKDVVGDDLVLNLPDDGSAFAYATADINTYYRNTRTYGGSSESADSKAIRENLCSVSTSPEVNQALRNLNVRYVLLLDEGTTDNMPHLFTWDFYSDLWDGVSSISDETPGFEAVLSEGDMRLYKVAV